MNNAKVFSDEAAAIYERAISSLMKKNMLIYFAYADFEEVRDWKREGGVGVNQLTLTLPITTKCNNYKQATACSPSVLVIVAFCGNW